MSAAEVNRRGVRLAHLAVGAGNNGDDVLPRCIDEDQRNAGRTIHFAHAGEVDAARTEQSQRRAGEIVAPDCADHPQRRPRPRRGKRLVGALSSGCCVKCAAWNSFARSRKAFHAADQIKIDRAENRDHKSFAVSFFRSNGSGHRDCHSRPVPYGGWQQQCHKAVTQERPNGRPTRLAVGIHSVSREA